MDIREPSSSMFNDYHDHDGGLPTMVPQPTNKFNRSGVGSGGSAVNASGDFHEVLCLDPKPSSAASRQQQQQQQQDKSPKYFIQDEDCTSQSSEMYKFKNSSNSYQAPQQQQQPRHHHHPQHQQLQVPQQPQQSQKPLKVCLHLRELFLHLRVPKLTNVQEF